MPLRLQATRCGSSGEEEELEASENFKTFEEIVWSVSHDRTDPNYSDRTHIRFPHSFQTSLVRVPGTRPKGQVLSGGSAPAPPSPVGLKASEMSAFEPPQGCAFGSLGKILNNH